MNSGGTSAENSDRFPRGQYGAPADLGYASSWLLQLFGRDV
jgi:hypothetical protein